MRVAVTLSTFGEAGAEPLEKLRATGCEVVLNPHGRPLRREELMEFLQGTSAVISGTDVYSAEVFDAAPDLRVISRVGRSLSGIDLSAARRHGVSVFRTPDPLANSVAELTVGGILSSFRHVPTAHTALQEGGWTRRMGRLLKGATVGIVGCGRIGRRVIELLKPFDARVMVCDIHLDAEFARGNRCAFYDFDDVIRVSDVVSLHLPLSYESWRMIGAAELARMKPDALLVNTSDAGLVDHEALLAHLERHPSFSAFLDVFDEEPYEGPLRDRENVLLTPRIGGYARESRLQMEIEAVDSALAQIGLS